MTNLVNINEVLDGHVGLDLACIDRLYLNAYVPILQVGGQVQRFCKHLDQPIASPAVIEKIGNRFRREVDAFTRDHDVPILHLKKPDRTRWDDRKLDHVRPYMDKAAGAGRYGVVAVVAGQEYQYVFSATKKTKGTAVWFDWNKTEQRVGCFYLSVGRTLGQGVVGSASAACMNAPDRSRSQAGAPGAKRGRTNLTPARIGASCCRRDEADEFR